MVEPHSTLFVIASKTFTTQETLRNAETARGWFIERTGDAAAIGRHFVAVSTNMTATAAFGIDAERVFELGKTLAGEVAAGLRGQTPAPDQDSSTRALIERYRRRAGDVPKPPSTG